MALCPPPPAYLSAGRLPRVFSLRSAKVKGEVGGHPLQDEANCYAVELNNSASVPFFSLARTHTNTCILTQTKNY